MRTSENTSNLFYDLILAQMEIGGAVKDSANPFFKSTYADLTSVIKEIKPILNKHKLGYIQHPVSNDNGVGVTTRIIHVSGEWIEEGFTLPLVKDDPQAGGSAITYARRYALKSMLGMPDIDDDAEGAMFRTAQPYTDEQKAELVSLVAAKDGMGIRRFYDEVGQEVMDALFNSAPKGEKTAFKQQIRDLYGEANKMIKAYLQAFEDAIEKDDELAVKECWTEMDDLTREFVEKGMSEVMKTQLAKYEEAA